MANKQPSGTIWTHGTHQLYYDGKPTKLYTPRNTISQAYNSMRQTLDKQGYIPLGIDHLSNDTLKQNPILNKTLKTAQIDPHHVGEITKIGLENDKIRIIDAKITNPFIQELYDKGEIPAYSIVTPAKLKDCPTGVADKIVSEFGETNRVDFVMAGGCKDCLVESDMITAKLSNGGPNMPENDIQEDINVNEDVQETEEVEEVESTEESVEETEEVEVEDEQEEAPLTEAGVNQIILDIVKPLIQGETQTVTAKLAEIETETLTNKLAAKIDKKIEAGFATPAMKEGLIASGLHVTDEKFDEILASLSTKVWDNEQQADTSREASESETEMSVEDAIERLGGQ